MSTGYAVEYSTDEGKQLKPVQMFQAAAEATSH
jgi:hypothetical protein